MEACNQGIGLGGQVDNSNIVKMLRSEFRAELGAVKNENKVLVAKMGEFQEQNGVLKARLETVERKLKEKTKENEALEKMEQMGQNLLKFTWRNNRWSIFDDHEHYVRVNADGLSFTAEEEYNINVRASQPISREFLAIGAPGLQQLVYFEVTMKDSNILTFGWAGPELPLIEDSWVGTHRNSYGIDSRGNYNESGRTHCYSAQEFHSGDVLGSGLMIARDGNLKIFFTQNGHLNVMPRPLDVSADQLLYPAVGLYYKNTYVEANFGADPRMPFRFDIEDHEIELFG